MEDKIETVWKYKVEYGKNEIEMPIYSAPIYGSFREFNEELNFWAEVDSESRKVIRTFYVIFTGEEIPRQDTENALSIIIGTAIRNGLVYHLFFIME